MSGLALSGIREVSLEQEARGRLRSRSRLHSLNKAQLGPVQDLMWFEMTDRHWSLLETELKEVLGFNMEATCVCREELDERVEDVQQQQDDRSLVFR